MKELFEHRGKIGSELDKSLFYQIIIIGFFFGIELGDVEE